MSSTRKPALPDFLIVGAAKSATTSLGYYLDEHPQVFVPRHEGHFFDREDNWRQGTAFYDALFAGRGSAGIIGEKTPGYCYGPKVDSPIPRRIAALVPDVRLIWCLRNPVDRAYSQFWHAVVRGRETRSFPQALRAEARCPRHFQQAYRDRGVYAPQVRRFLEVFPPEQMFYVITERLQREPAQTLADLFHFLGVDSGFVGKRAATRVNTARRLLGPRWTAPWVTWFLSKMRPKRRRLLLERWGTTRPPLDAELRVQLEDYYRPHNEELAALTGIDLSLWTDS